MLTKVMGIGALVMLIGCSSKPAADTTSAPEQTAATYAQKAPAGPSGFDSDRVAQPVTVPAGTHVRVRLEQAVSTQHNHAGDRFTATLESPIVMGEKTVVPRGTEFQGHVTSAEASGRLKGRAVVAVTLDSFDLNGKSYKIETSSASQASAGHKKRNSLFIGGGAGLGAALGAVAGGGKGALIGAGAGAAAGTGGAAATGKENTGFPVESLLTFSLRAPLRI